MKNHLKRIASPRTWIINRKENKFILRPAPGGHSLDSGMPLGVIMRDVLRLASTMGEVKKILNNKEVLIDGIRRKDHSFLVGLFDAISIPELKRYHRLVLDNKGRIVFSEIDEKESKLKLSKVTGKTALKKGKMQLNLHDGKNIITEEKAKVGDSVLLDLPKLTIKKVLPLKEGMSVFLTKGKHAGDSGILMALKGKEAKYSAREQEIETSKDYLFVVGEKEPEIKIGQ